jgi:hypothetical protein
MSALNNTIGERRAPDLLEYNNCTFELGDVSEFEQSGWGREWLRANADSAPTGLIFRLENARVVYHGGPLIPFSRLECLRCTYDLDFYTPPPDPGKQLTRQLLLAKDYSSIELSVQPGI